MWFSKRDSEDGNSSLASSKFIKFNIVATSSGIQSSESTDRASTNDDDLLAFHVVCARKSKWHGGVELV